MDLTGVILASPILDYQVTDTYFVVAHFHYVVFGTVVFAMFAGFYFWWPKMTGRMLDEKLGKLHFWLLFIGFHTTFLVQHWLGVEGMPRRYASYGANEGFTTLNQVSSVGAFILGASTLPFLYNVYKSRRSPLVGVDDPWGWGRSLEWATSSPAAAAQLRRSCRGSGPRARPSTYTTRTSRWSPSTGPQATTCWIRKRTRLTPVHAPMITRRARGGRSSDQRLARRRAYGRAAVEAGQVAVEQAEVMSQTKSVRCCARGRTDSAEHHRVLFGTWFEPDRRLTADAPKPLRQVSVGRALHRHCSGALSAILAVGQNSPSFSPPCRIDTGGEGCPGWASLPGVGHRVRSPVSAGLWSRAPSARAAQSVSQATRAETERRV